MASKMGQVFSVTRKTPELIVPAKPIPREILKLSDIDDQEGLRFQVPFICFYRNEPSMKGRDPVKVIREALRRALVFYYPFVGRLKELDSTRKLVVDCTGELGIWFIEADGNLKLEELGEAIRAPMLYLDQLLYNVPGSDGIIGCPLMLFQVTRLACGGFVLAIRGNHTMSDAAGLSMFLKTMEEMARDAHAEPSLLPVWRRELLNCRDPPRITCTHHEYEDNTRSTTNSTTGNNGMNQLDQKSFYFGPNEKKALRAHLPLHLRNNCSIFDLLAACVWKCRTAAFDLNPNEIVRVSCIVSIRDKQYNLNLPPGYYGNAFLIPAECTTADLLCKSPLGYAVELVKKTKAKMNEEYVRSAVDLLVIKGRPMYVTMGNFLVSDNTRAGFVELDFGWGKPVLVGAVGATPLLSFFVKYETKNGENGTLVPICLPSSVMVKFEQELKKMIKGPNIEQDLCSKL